MKILISGVCGFVGSRLAAGLKSSMSGVSVFGVDNLSRRGSETSLELLKKNGVGFFHGDIRGHFGGSLQPFQPVDPIRIFPAAFVLRDKSNRVRPFGGDPRCPVGFKTTNGQLPRPAIPLTHYVASTALVGVTLGLAAFLHSTLALPDPEMLFLLTVMVTAIWFGRGPSLFAAALGVAAYDFFFVPPYLTFAVADRRYRNSSV